MATKRLLRVVLIDLSGTLHVGDEQIPGAIDALKRLRESNVVVRFVTNTTKESRRLLHERLKKIGLDIEENEIFTSLISARDTIASEKLHPYLMVDEEAKEDFVGCFDVTTEANDADSVLIGLAPDKFSYEHMNQAMRILHRGGQLLAIHKARYFKAQSGLVLGPGPFVTALEHSCDTKARVIGKPSANFFLSSFRDVSSPPGQVVMIGDDVKDDVIGAQQAGLIGVLVKTGKYRAGDEKAGAIDFVAESIVTAVDWILNQFTIVGKGMSITSDKL